MEVQGTLVYTCILHVLEAEAGGSGVKDHYQLHSQSEATLDTAPNNVGGRAGFGGAYLQSGFRRQKREACHKSEASLVYEVRPCSK